MEQRYGIRLSERDARLIVKAILKGHARFKKTDIRGGERYEIGYRGLLLEVVYAPKENRLLTAYPPAARAQSAALRLGLMRALFSR